MFFSEEPCKTNPEIGNDKQLLKLISEFRKQCEKYEQEYSLIKNTELQNDFKVKSSTDFPPHWAELKQFFLEFTKNVCPVCSTELQRDAHIDHFRNRKNYWWLAYETDNYQILCFDCNSAYKRTDFPVQGRQIDFNSFTTKAELNKIEKPLLLNPFFDNPTDYFTLVFYEKLNTIEVIVGIDDKECYDYDKALKSIEVYNLDDSKKDVKSNRKQLFRKRFFALQNYAKARMKFMKTKTKEDFIRYKTNEKRTKVILSDSWIDFIKKGRFKFSLAPSVENLKRKI